LNKIKNQQRAHAVIRETLLHFGKKHNKQAFGMPEKGSPRIAGLLIRTCHYNDFPFLKRSTQTNLYSTSI
jgi:hypothetical protein